MRRQDILDHVRALGVVPHGQLFIPRIPVRQYRARLEAYAGVAAEYEGLLDDMVGLGVGRLDVAEFRLAAPCEIVAQAFMNDRRRAVESGLGVGDRRQDLPVDLDQRRRILRQGPALGDDGDHRLALPGRLFERQGVLRRRFQAFEMRQHPDPGVVNFGEFPPRDDRDHAPSPPSPERRRSNACRRGREATADRRHAPSVRSRCRRRTRRVRARGAARSGAAPSARCRSSGDPESSCPS